MFCLSLSSFDKQLGLRPVTSKEDEFALAEIFTVVTLAMQRDELEDLLRSRPTGCLIGLLCDEMKYALAVVANTIRHCQFGGKLNGFDHRPT